MLACMRLAVPLACIRMIYGYLHALPHRGWVTFHLLGALWVFATLLVLLGLSHLRMSGQVLVLLIGVCVCACERCAASCCSSWVLYESVALRVGC
jgi:hypothetical protein